MFEEDLGTVVVEVRLRQRALLRRNFVRLVTLRSSVWWSMVSDVVLLWRQGRLLKSLIS